MKRIFFTLFCCCLLASVATVHGHGTSDQNLFAHLKDKTVVVEVVTLTGSTVTVTATFVSYDVDAQMLEVRKAGDPIKWYPMTRIQSITVPGTEQTESDSPWRCTDVTLVDPLPATCELGDVVAHNPPAPAAKRSCVCVSPTP